MSAAGTRPYASTLRDAQARQTRRQIVAAASRLFAQQGFAATTIDAIAAEAGVSRKTVFTSVGNKVALLRLAYDYAMAGDDEPIPMVQREGLQAVIAETDPYEQLRLFAAFVTETGSRVSALWLALRGAAEVDEQARDLFSQWEQERLDGMREGPVQALVHQGVLRADVTPDEAAAILWVLVDPALHHRMVIQAGWTSERFSAWLHDAFVTQFLVPRGERQRAPRSRPADPDSRAP